MKTFIQNGDAITVTMPTGGTASGGGNIFGSLFGVAVFTAAEGESAEIATTGLYELHRIRLAASGFVCCVPPCLHRFVVAL